MNRVRSNPLEIMCALRELLCETPQETEWMGEQAALDSTWWGSCARGNSLWHRRSHFAIRKMNPAFLWRRRGVSAPSLVLSQTTKRQRRRFLSRVDRSSKLGHNSSFSSLQYSSPKRLSVTIGENHTTETHQTE